MSDISAESVHQSIDHIYRGESRWVLATLIRLLRDFELAEQALHDAFIAALQQWPRDGIPANPRSWLISTGRFKAIDQMRRRSRFNNSLATLAEQLASYPEEKTDHDEEIQDDMLRLVFTCCHPALPPDGQVALTLREVCGLTTEAIAHTFLISPTTVAQRIVRAKAKIRDAHIPYKVPSRYHLPERLDSVLRVIYLVFNEGYFASSGESLTRPDLSAEAIRLGRLLARLLPRPEALGLLALMLLHESRRAARTTRDGEVIPLEDQNRRLWNRGQIDEGLALVQQALSLGRAGPYTVQAAIIAVHVDALSADQTDWEEIVGLYDVLLRLQHSPIVELNRAVAVAMRDGPAEGIGLIDTLLQQGELIDYPLAHTAQAELYRRLGQTAAARAGYERALVLTRQEPERRLLKRRLAELPDKKTQENQS
jgi:RNA polymerase sigma-70 factor, ECF subfamily